MSAIDNLMLAFSSPVKTPWYHGIHVMEHVELFIIVILFFGVLGTVYYIQRWIGDY